MVLLIDCDCGEPVITCDHSMLPQHNESLISIVHVATKHNFMLQTLTRHQDRMFVFFVLFFTNPPIVQIHQMTLLMYIWQ